MKILKRVRDDLKHLHNTTQDDRTRDYLKGLILDINTYLMTHVDTATEYGIVRVENNNKESEVL